MKNNFFRQLGHIISLPFAGPVGLLSAKSANRKAIKYRNNPEDFAKELRYSIVYKLCKKAIFLLNIDLEVRGIKNLLKKPMFICPNHKSNIDPILLARILFELKGFPYYNFVAKKELEEDKLSKGCIELIDSIMIDRENIRDIPRVINEETKALMNNSVICFLEGKRITEDHIEEFKATGLEPAYRTLVPIVPVVIWGTTGIFSSEEKHRFRYKKVVVEFLEPIKHQEYLNQSKEYMAEKIRNRIQEKYNEIKKEFEVQENGRNKQ